MPTQSENDALATYMSHRTVHRDATIPAGALDRDGRYRKRRHRT
jgi:hypothetical protein